MDDPKREAAFRWLLLALIALLAPASAVWAQEATTRGESAPAPAREGAAEPTPPTAAETLSSVPIEVQDAPKIVFDATEKNLGAMEEGVVADFRFVVGNAGAKPLTIQRVESSCGCVQVQIEKSDLAPGEQTRIVGAFNSQNRPGKNTRAIAVHSNDPVQRKANLLLRAQVLRLVEVAPASALFREVAQRAGAGVKLRIESRLEPPLEIKKIRVLNTRAVTASVVSRETVPLPENVAARSGEAPLTRIVLEVNVKKDEKLGPFSGQLVLETNSEKRPQIGIPVSGRITGDLVVEPNVLRFGVLSPGDSVTKTCTVRSLTGQAFRIENVEAGDLPIAWKLAPAGESGSQTLQLTLTVPERPRGVYRGYLEIEVDHPTQQNLRVVAVATARGS
ncbi:MAG TPA: DUF1573 domain-containing protein [Sumerlaeia bacterium]|nr:DUF1573 domain-containing protein [Sumerlaeia bacterium]